MVLFLCFQGIFLWRTCFNFSMEGFVTQEFHCRKMTDHLMAASLEVLDDKFKCPLDNGLHAELCFEKRIVHKSDDEDDENAEHIYEFYHIEVPSECRGKGVAMPFAKACFDYAKEHNWKVKVTCTYLREKFLGQYSEKYKTILY